MIAQCSGRKDHDSLSRVAARRDLDVFSFVELLSSTCSCLRHGDMMTLGQ